MTPQGNVSSPVIAQATKSGEIVGFNLQNTNSVEIPAQTVTLNEVFALGAVPKGSGLSVTINGVTYPAQLDAKTFNSDGSVASGIVTIDAPAIPAGTSVSAMLNLVSNPPASPAVDLSSALNNYNLSATLNITANQGGSIGTQTVNIANAVRQALAAGTAQTWLKGPLASEAIVSIPVTGSLRIEADVTAYANGQIKATLQFNNDAAMQANGGTITYSATVTQNGVVVDQQSSLTQYQYQDWSTTTGTAPSSAGLNVQHDIAYLEKLGVVPNYDLKYGVPGQNITGEAAAIVSKGWNAPLGIDGITQYMPMTGGRGDIGPTTQSNADWLITQNNTAAQYALGQAKEAGSVPWHFYDPTANGAFLNTADYPDIWTDSRGGPSSYTTGLTQQVANTGWSPDTAHMPDLNYVSYMLTGNVKNLEQLNAQASFAITDFWPYPRQNGAAIVVSGGNQVRGSAWSLRTIQEAAYANPTGSADKAYFTSVMDANYKYLISQIPTLTKEEGQAYGYLPGAYGYNGATLPPWEEDYFASTVIQGAEMGNQDAVTYLKWASNFLVGRFFAANQGFDPQNGIAYNLTVGPSSGNFSSGPYYQTWAEIQQKTQASGQSNVLANGTMNWAHSAGDYGALAMQTLAGIVTVSNENPTVMGDIKFQAMQAWGWILDSGAPYTTPAEIAAGNPQFLIDPRLANGKLLSFGNMVLSHDAAGGSTALTPIDTTQNALLYAGNGSDTLIGGSGINVMFGGAGNDVIYGGANGNDIFAGAGNDTIIAGGGNTYIKASSTAELTAGNGKDLFVIDAASSGTVTIAGFNSSLDKIDIVDGSGNALSASQLNSIELTATTVAGGIQYKISPNETLLVANETVSSSTWFGEQNQAVTPSAALIAQAKANNIPSVSGSSGNSGSGSSNPSPPSNPIAIITSGNAQTVVGGSGGSATDSISGASINAQQTGQQDYLTITGSNDTINAQGGPGIYPTYGNTDITGNSDQMTVTGGSVTMSGGADSVTSPNPFGYMVVDEIGTHDYVDLTKTSQISVGGSYNTAIMDIQSGGSGPNATIGGSHDTVTASVYSPIVVTGNNNLINLSGEAAATVLGSNNPNGNTFAITGFDNVTEKTGNSTVSLNGGGNFSSVITTDSTAGSTIYLGANANASLAGSGKVNLIDQSTIQGNATVAGFNPTTDVISLPGANGSVPSSAQIDAMVKSATVNGSSATFDIGNGATLTLTDLTAAPNASWFAAASVPVPPPPPEAQTISGGGNSTVDSISGSSINAQQLGRSDYLTVTGSNDTINAKGGAGSYASYGNFLISGQNDQITDTGGVVTATGKGDTINSPYTFGFLDVNATGTDQTVIANSFANVSIAGSDNTGVLDLKYGGGPNPAAATVGGTGNTVSASVYTPLLVNGSADVIHASGEAAVTVAGATNTAADTIVATGFDRIVTESGNAVISVPGGSWNPTINDGSANDTIFAGTAAPGGGNQININGGTGMMFINDNVDSGRKIIMTAGRGAVTATGASNNSVFVGGTDGNNYLAASGNSTLIGNGGSNTLVGGAGSELLASSTVTGAANTFMIDHMSASDMTTITGFGATGTHDMIDLGSGISIKTTTVSPTSGTLVSLNDGSKILLSGFNGTLHTSEIGSGTVLAA